VFDFLEANKPVIEGVFKSLGISTPIDTIYQALLASDLDGAGKVRPFSNKVKDILGSFSTIFEGLSKKDNQVEVDE
jgi:hypothetical protein